MLHERVSGIHNRNQEVKKSACVIFNRETSKKCENYGEEEDNIKMDISKTQYKGLNLIELFQGGLYLLGLYDWVTVKRGISRLAGQSFKKVPLLS
jgi:hypothetical protein